MNYNCKYDNNEIIYYGHTRGYSMGYNNCNDGSDIGVGYGYGRSWEYIYEKGYGDGGGYNNLSNVEFGTVITKGARVGSGSRRGKNYENN